MVIYNALDWGIDSHMERELSKPLENLISLMLKLDVEATTPAIGLQDVIKVFWVCLFVCLFFNSPVVENANVLAFTAVGEHSMKIWVVPWRIGT